MTGNSGVRLNLMSCRFIGAARLSSRGGFCESDGYGAAPQIYRAGMTHGRKEKNW
ncbi:hypothetical protein LMG27952_07730 [Paraburkholderia hiiakae]|uniref:Uncharacterized protein n=1 Tax=Paraburkholderia hiiakae TaxID=1081782 RepID=A0ABM8PBS2_9BURK|nr:hypothetical protein LMG27952_07730 [Paraburkholderia hiiakae]